MQSHLKKFFFFLTSKNRILVFTLGFLVVFSFGTYVFATPPGSPYVPSDNITDPSCIPGATNCYVSIFPDQTSHTNEFLKTDGAGNVSWASAGGMAIGSAVTSGTSGSVLYVNSSGNLTQDNSNFFWDSTNHRLGLGTTTPAETLSIATGNILQTQVNTPTVKGTVTNAALAGSIGVDVSGKYAYVASSTSSSFSIVDVSNPDAPTLIGTVQDFAQLAGAFYTKVSGKYAYVTAASPADRLTIIDVSNPTAPTIVGALHDATNLADVRGLYISGKYAYVGAFSGDRLAIVDISNPAAPALVSALHDATNLDGADGVFVSGKYAYVAAKNSNALSIVDVSNPASMSLVGTVSSVGTLGGIHEIYVSGKYAYTANQNASSFAVINVSNPASPSIVGSVSSVTTLASTKALTVAGRYAYLTTGSGNRFTIIDISSPSSPVVVNSLSDAVNLATPRDIKVVGKYAYVAMNTGLTVLDLNGIDTQGANIGSLASQSITISENADIGNNIYIRNGLNVGQGGIQSAGPLTLQGLTSGATSAVLDVHSSSGGSLLYVQDNGNVGIATSFTPAYTLDVGNGGVTGVVAHFVNSTGTCDINPTTTALVCSSDERLKRDVVSIPSSLDLINRLNPVTYKWNTQTDDAIHPGFIAQQLEVVIPSLVSTDAKGFKSVAYSNLTPYLTKAIQEIDVKIEPLTSMDPNRSGSLASRIVLFLADAVISIKEATIGTLRINNQVCVDDVCVSKDQFKNLLQNATGGNNSGSTTTGGGTTGGTTTESDTTTTTGSDTTTGGAIDTTGVGTTGGTVTGGESGGDSTATEATTDTTGGGTTEGGTGA